MSQEYQKVTEMLEKRRGELSGVIKRAREALRSEQERDFCKPLDGLDLTPSSVVHEPLIKAAEIATETIKEIDVALARIKEGTYGICADCGGKISPRRLEALPFTVFCIDCKKLKEIKTSEEV